MQDEASPYHAGGQIDHEKLQWLRGLLDDDVSLAKAYAQIHRRHFENRAAASVVEAVVYELGIHGLAQLKKPNCRQRLGELSPEQLREALARLIKLRPKYPKITDKLLLRLEDLLP
jgi:hypothetical protein